MTERRESMVTEIERFIEGRFRAALASGAMTSDTPLFSSGIIDSFGVLELIAFLEESFSADIDPARHDLSEFDTVEKIVSLIGRLQQRGGGR